MSQDIVYERDMFHQLRALTSQLRFQCGKLNNVGLERYFQGFCHIYQFLWTQNEAPKKKFLKLVKKRLHEAFPMLDSEKMFKEEACLILDYLEKMILNAREVSEPYIKLTRSTFNIHASECLLRMALLEMYGGDCFKPKYLTLEESLHQAELHYNKATHGRGYRGQLLKYLKRFRCENKISAEEQGRIMQSIDSASEYWKEDMKIEVGPREPDSCSFLDENLYTQLAFSTGWFTSIVCQF